VLQLGVIVLKQRLECLGIVWQRLSIEGFHGELFYHKPTIQLRGLMILLHRLKVQCRMRFDCVAIE
jgi:hypothetical protein